MPRETGDRIEKLNAGSVPWSLFLEGLVVEVVPPTRTAARSTAAVDRVPDPPCHVGMVAACRAAEATP